MSSFVRLDKDPVLWLPTKSVVGTGFFHFGPHRLIDLSNVHHVAAFVLGLEQLPGIVPVVGLDLHVLESVARQSDLCFEPLLHQTLLLFDHILAETRYVSIEFSFHRRAT